MREILRIQSSRPPSPNGRTVRVSIATDYAVGVETLNMVS